MFKFAFKNMAIKKAKIILVVISIVISACVGLLAYNVAQQVDSGFKTTAGYYDIIIGPSGSSTQLAMNTMFFTEKPLGTISYDYVEKLEKDMRVNKVVPFTMGDSYNAAKIVGTTADFLDGKDIKDGTMFTGKFQCVIGAAVAEKYSLTVGSQLITSHGLTGEGHAHESNPLAVVGILKETKTAYDNVIFTPIETVWATHNHSEENHDEHEEKNHEHHGDVCAILVKSKSFNAYSQLSAEYGENSKLLVINPSEVLREVLENVDMSTTIVYILCIIILIMNIFIISVITLLNMYDSKKEIALMRLIGIGMNKINLVYIIQNGIIGLISTILAFAASRLCLVLMGGYVSSMGIVLDTAKIYPVELMIMAVVFVISVLPTVICTVNMSKKDGISQ
ncbi:MAG: ABC transporter permease [Clostridia bacterium]|jgi:ABC-type lipoprotein release transport system permease subunit|nr:ABC transporter permease [Clostridia bacterium]